METRVKIRPYVSESLTSLLLLWFRATIVEDALPPTVLTPWILPRLASVCLQKFIFISFIAFVFGLVLIDWTPWLHVLHTEIYFIRSLLLANFDYLHALLRDRAWYFLQSYDVGRNSFDSHKVPYEIVVCLLSKLFRCVPLLHLRLLNLLFSELSVLFLSFLIHLKCSRSIDSLID